jgi:general secretion pathway protein A
LGNFESANEKLLQIVLVGQSELDVVLSSEPLRQFKQRIALRFAIQPLSGKDIGQYIAYRWMKAGGSATPFTTEAVESVGQVSQGVPRVINVICDNALMQAFGEESAAVEVRHVMSACQDLRLVEAVPQMAAVAAGALAAMPAVEWVFIDDLERYALTDSRPSLLTKLASKLGLKRRIETA